MTLLSPRLNLPRLPALIIHHQRLSSIRISHRLIVRRSTRIRHTHAHGKNGLQFIHPRLYFVMFNRLPHIGRPEFVQLVRILHIKHLIRINFVLAVTLESDGTA